MHSVMHAIVGSREPFKMNSGRTITYLSPPAEVSMADRWFEVASVDHFWVRRRFEVFQQMVGSLIPGAREIADIHQQDSSLRERFDLLFLFDVLEHVADEDRFLRAVQFHLAFGGKLVVNVPAGAWAYSAYDQAAGHVRRYSIRSLLDAARRNGLRPIKCTYWGLPLVPTLLLRKLWLWRKRDRDQVISAGFNPRTKFLNRSLSLLAKREPIPQQFLGTSIMAIFERDGV